MVELDPRTDWRPELLATMAVVAAATTNRWAKAAQTSVQAAAKFLAEPRCPHSVGGTVNVGTFSQLPYNYIE